MSATATIAAWGAVEDFVNRLTTAERLATRALVHRAIVSRARLGWPAPPSVLTPASGPVPIALAALCLALGEPDGFRCPACAADLEGLQATAPAGERS